MVVRGRAGFVARFVGVWTRAGMSGNYISEVERANMECSLTALVKIARALGVRVLHLARRI